MQSQGRSRHVWVVRFISMLQLGVSGGMLPQKILEFRG